MSGLRSAFRALVRRRGGGAGVPYDARYSPELLDQVSELIRRAESDPGEAVFFDLADGTYFLRVVRLEGDGTEPQSGADDFGSGH